MKYFEWEGAVIEAVAESMAISHSDAAGVVEAQPFYMQQSWGKGMDAQLTAAKVIEAAQEQAAEELAAGNLTFESICDAYAALLEGQPGKALLLPDNCAVFLEGGNVYGVTVSPSGEVEMDSAGCISPVAWDDERGCWEADDSAEITVAPINTPVFIDLPAE